MRGAAIAEIDRLAKGCQPAVGLVDDHRLLAREHRERRLHRRIESHGAIERLLDEHDLLVQPCQRRRRLDPRDQLEEVVGAPVLLVAVERDVERASAAVEHGGNRLEPRDVLVQPAGHLDLQIGDAVALEVVLQGLGQAVVDRRLEAVGGRDRIEEADGVPHMQALQRPVGQEGADLVAAQLLGQAAEIDPQAVARTSCAKVRPVRRPSASITPRSSIDAPNDAPSRLKSRASARRSISGKVVRQSAKAVWQPSLPASR